MNIAILGGTSQIARDMTALLAVTDKFRIAMFGRRPGEISDWISTIGISGAATAHDFTDFGDSARYDAIFNFVGVGSPAKAAAMGTTILDVTLEYDSLALAYVKRHPDCRYFFLSSGAVYGGGFNEPVSSSTPAVVPINHLSSQDWYGIAKLAAECRHRALVDLPIVDLRVFSYFSSTQDLEARFLISDVLRAIRDRNVLATSSDQIVRDFLHPEDFVQLIEVLLGGSALNCAVDCYSRAPVDKLGLLLQLQESFGLRYTITNSHNAINATGSKTHYYSINRHAESFGYQPKWTSLNCIVTEGRKALRRAGFND